MANKTLYFRFPIEMMRGVLSSDSETKQQFLENLLYFHLYTQFDSADLIENTNEVATFSKYALNGWCVELGNAERSYSNGKELANKYKKAKSFTSLNTSIFWQFYKEIKSSNEWLALFMFLALKSIIGAKSYGLSNNALLLSRMDGYSIMQPREKLSFKITNYRIQETKNDLRLDWGLSYYAQHTRGFYFSFKLPIEKLIKIAEEQKRSNKLKALKEKEQKILQELRK